MARSSRLRISIFAVALAGASASAQTPPPRITASDSAIIARELAAWDALQKNDSGAAFRRIVGNSPTVVIVGPGGIARLSAAEMGRRITVNCDRRRNPIDSARVDRLSRDVVMLSYKVTVDGRCDSDTAWTTTRMYSMTVWAREGTRWRLRSQGYTALGGFSR